MPSAINWSMPTGSNLPTDPTYLLYSAMSFMELTIAVDDVKTSLKFALASNESADLVAYLSWVLRCIQLAS